MLRWVSALGGRVALRVFTLVHALETSARLPGPVLRCALTAAALAAPVAGNLAAAVAAVSLAAAHMGGQAGPEQRAQEASKMLFALQTTLGEQCHCSHWAAVCQPALEPRVHGSEPLGFCACMCARVRARVCVWVGGALRLLQCSAPAQICQHGACPASGVPPNPWLSPGSILCINHHSPHPPG